MPGSERFREDIATVRTHDPDTGARGDVLVYGGIYALMLHRVAHRLWQRDRRLLARIISQVNRWLTGVEIHPAATLGRRIFFWPGGAIVIGETAVIGDDVVIANDVTLGGTGKEQGKRHPTIEDGVVIGPGARVLGALTVGAGARIESGAVVVKPVPAGATAIGIPARLITPTGAHGTPPPMAIDPYDRVLRRLRSDLQGLDQRLNEVANGIHAQHHRLTSDPAHDLPGLLVES